MQHVVIRQYYLGLLARLALLGHLAQRTGLLRPTEGHRQWCNHQEFMKTREPHS